MQRVLSGQTARCSDSSEEVVSKRLCLSFMIVCAFFSVVGGFFLGRYAFNHVSQHMDEKNPFTNVTSSLAYSANKISNLATEISRLPSFRTFNYSSELYLKSNCKLSACDNMLKYNNLSIPEIILADLGILDKCYYNVTIFLESVLTRFSDSKDVFLP